MYLLKLYISRTKFGNRFKNKMVAFVFLLTEHVWVQLTLQNSYGHQTSIIYGHLRFHVSFVSLSHPCSEMGTLIFGGLM